MTKNIFTVLFSICVLSFSTVRSQGGNSLSFDGSNDYVELNSAINISGSSFTMECWFKATTQSGYFMVIGSSSGGTRLSAGIKLNPQQTGYDWDNWDGMSWPPPEIITPSNIQYFMYGDDHTYNWTSDGNWHHVAFTFNSSNQLGTLYLDGTSVASATFGGNMTGSGKARLCASTWATDGPFSGQVDEVRIWNTTRTAAEISDNKNNLTLSPATSGLVAYYHFDQGTASGDNSGVSSLTDETSHSYNGTLTNFALSGSTSNWVAANNSALPVELISFIASENKGSVVLNWQTATEVNNYGFNVERRVQKEEWKQIAFVNGHGNSNSPKNYSFTDLSLISGKVQYRLKQIDFDGKYEYSDIVEVDLEAPANFALNQNHPNPFNPETTISYQLPSASHVSLKVYDALGREVATLVDEFKQAGNYNSKFSTQNSKLSSGVYFYKLSAGSFSQTQKMLLIK